jgi:phenylacetate-CoA ligase
MSLKVARISDNFILPGGRVVHGEFFTHLMYGTEGIRNFQFHQTAPGSITLLVVPDGGKDSERARAVRAAREQVEALAPGEVSLEVREVEAIPLSSAGKHRFIRSDVSAAASSSPELLLASESAVKSSSVSQGSSAL